MKYMFLLFNPEPAIPPTPEQMAAEMPKWETFGQQTARWNYQSGGEALQPSATATVVSVRDGKTMTTDGPFIDTKEQLGGYYVFDCRDLDQAIEIAAKVPWAPTGHIEVRPVIEFDQPPPSRP